MTRCTSRISLRRAGLCGLLLLILGAATTLLIAWSLAPKGPTRWALDQGWKIIPADEVPRAMGYGDDLDTFIGLRAWVQHRLGTSAWWVIYGSGRSFEDVYIATGFPARAAAGLRCTVSRQWVRETRGISVVEVPWLGRHLVPTTILIPGFIINTLFYAAGWFGVFFGVAALRRAIRKKRGRCVKCGYDLRGSVANGQDARSTSQDARSAGCAECGWNRE